jgi:hypothetical protein
MFRLGGFGMWQNPTYHRELIRFDWRLWKNAGECLRWRQIKLSDVTLVKLVKGVASVREAYDGFTPSLLILLVFQGVFRRLSDELLYD